MSFISFILSLWKFRPGLLALNVALLVVRTLAEGLGLILLVPLLALVGVASEGGTSWFTDILRSAFDRLGFDLSLGSYGRRIHAFFQAQSLYFCEKLLVRWSNRLHRDLPFLLIV